MFIGPLPNSLPASMFVDCFRVMSIGQERIEVEVGGDGNIVRFLLGNRCRLAREGSYKQSCGRYAAGQCPVDEDVLLVSFIWLIVVW